MTRTRLCLFAVPLLAALAAAGCRNPVYEAARCRGASPSGRLAAAAVAVGLTRLDPAAYGGWSGSCPGADVDAQTFAIACAQHGVPATLLLDSAATRPAIVAAAVAAAEAVEDGGLLALFISSHGIRRQDASGDETDGMDELLCLYDGPLLDDNVWTLLLSVPRGIRVWLITDCCHSGSNYRGGGVRYAPAASERGGALPDLLHWGAASDGRYAYGSLQGGVFTAALVDAFEPGQSYSSWYERVRTLMPPGQAPSVSVIGRDFTTRPAFR